MSKLRKALEKAKEARKAERGAFIKEVEVLSAIPSQPTKRIEPISKEVSPAYSQTKTVSIDPGILKKNKIISLFHEEAMTDQIKILRTQVLNRMDEVGGNSLLVTSANPGEGKTFTAINLAISISHELDHTVLLVDADLRTPSIHHYLGLEVNKGLADYLLRQAEVLNLLLNPEIERLVILPCDKSLPNSSELLGSPRMESLVKEMKERYADRFIIFDSSSLLTSADPLVFSRFVDGVLLVVEAEKTSTKDVKQALELLKDKTLVGTVLNKAKN